jgi:hypothetical protein
MSQNLITHIPIPKYTRGFEPIIYRGALLSTLLHAIVYIFYTICWMLWYRLRMKWDYKTNTFLLSARTLYSCINISCQDAFCMPIIATFCFQTIQLRVTVAENTGQPRAYSIGHVIVGSQAAGKALSHWNQMLSSLRKPIAMWHPLRKSDVRECCK